MELIKAAAMVFALMGIVYFVLVFLVHRFMVDPKYRIVRYHRGKEFKPYYELQIKTFGVYILEAWSADYNNIYNLMETLADNDKKVLPTQIMCSRD